MPSQLVLFSTVVALLTTSLTVSATDVDIAAVPATTSATAATTRPRSLYRACKADLARLCTPKRSTEADAGSERRMHVSPAAAYKCLEQRTSELEGATCKAWIAGRQTCLTDVRPKLSQCTAAVRAVAMREERAAARDSALIQKAVDRARIEAVAEANVKAAAAPPPASGAAAADATAAAKAEAGRKQIARVDKRVAALVGNATARVRPEVLMRCLRELPESAIGAACTATDFYSSFSMFKAEHRGSRSREFRGRIGKRDFFLSKAGASAATTAAAAAAKVVAAPVVAAEKAPVAAQQGDQAARASKKEKLANLIAAALDVAVDDKAGDSAKVVAAAADVTAAPAAVPEVIAAAVEKEAVVEKATAAAIVAAPVAEAATLPAVEKTVE